MNRLKHKFYHIINIHNGILAVLISLCPGKTGHAQEIWADSLKQSLVNYRQHHIQEKIYLHTDRSFYITGEVLWFKVYVTDAHMHLPGTLSSVAHIEINNPALKTKWETSIELKDGKGDGSILIPSWFTTGNYSLRAYTNWMKNLGPEYYFEKAITLVNPQKKPVFKEAQFIQQAQIDYFPEGGRLVPGLPGTLGFHIHNEQGYGINSPVYLVKGEIDTIVRTGPMHAGMGKLSFTPQKGETYRILSRIDGQRWISKILEMPDETGYTLQLEDPGNGELVLTVRAAGEKNGSWVYLFLHCRQTLSKAMASTLHDGIARFKFLKSETGEGISHFTVFSDQRIPVAERLYFRQPEQVLKLTIHPDKEVYAERSLSTVSISGLDSFFIENKYSLSASVVKLDSLPAEPASHITSYFMLESDLNGWVENPDFYFQPDKQKAENAADLLMLTKGWRRFRWDEVFQQGEPKFTYLPEPRGLLVERTILNKLTGKPAPGIAAYATIPGIRHYFSMAVSDSSGRAHFPLGRLFGTGEIITQVEPGSDSLYKTESIPDTAARLIPKIRSPYRLSIHEKEKLEARIEAAQVQQAYYDPFAEEMPSFYARDTTAFFGLPDRTYNLDEFTRFNSMEEVLREYVTEVEVRKTKNQFRLMVRNRPYNTFFQDDPLMLVDGVPVFNANCLLNYDPLKIRSVDVLSRRFYAGGLTYPGILSFHTYNGDLEGLTLDPDALVMDFEGLQVKREFRAPLYPTDQERAGRKPDYRTLLWWTPEVSGDSSGKPGFRFYTSDLKGRFLILVQGMDNRGHIGFAEKIIEVR
jgi:hypothetical protein